MAHTFTSLLTHIVFSTKDRYPLPDERDRGRNPQLHHRNRQKPQNEDAGYQQNHRSPPHPPRDPPTLPLSEAVGKIKANSSKWIHEKFEGLGKFAWQTGYGAFSVSKSNAPDVIAYIHNQKDHHKKQSFQEEFVEFLVRNEIEYDKKYISE